jgi:hypothetical protein
MSIVCERFAPVRCFLRFRIDATPLVYEGSSPRIAINTSSVYQAQSPCQCSACAQSAEGWHGSGGAYRRNNMDTAKQLAGRMRATFTSTLRDTLNPTSSARLGHLITTEQVCLAIKSNYRHSGALRARYLTKRFQVKVPENRSHIWTKCDEPDFIFFSVTLRW